MRKLIQWTLLLVTVSSGAPLFAATATDFYLGLLRRGISEVDAGRNDKAVMPLRLAAFGLVESVDHYQTAQVYLAIAFDRMQQPDAAREAMVRILAAERVERKFAGLALPAPIRTAFAAVARKVLPSADAALLLTPSTPAVPASQPQPQTQTPQTSSQTTTPKKVVEKPVEKPAPSKPVVAQAKTTPPPPAPKPVQAQPAPPRVDVPALLAAGDRAMLAAKLAEARRAYRQLLAVPDLDHATSIRVAEGLYRSRDFAGALDAFARVGTLRSGEEAYRYYIAVALYETGQHERAKRELASALPFIEITPDVERYRARIEAAR
ncbi:MAG TPA: hypothetical protein VGQ36_11730 [Thermoanaerobaculia bacterium]|jgi:outer membrane biosynthesis protein TonB|nr:hypothetical protein [Thermoanaerobaculia bacterium]